MDAASGPLGSYYTCPGAVGAVGLESLYDLSRVDQYSLRMSAGAVAEVGGAYYSNNVYAYDSVTAPSGGNTGSGGVPNRGYELSPPNRSLDENRQYAIPTAMSYQQARQLLYNTGPGAGAGSPPGAAHFQQFDYDNSKSRTIEVGGRREELQRLAAKLQQQQPRLQLLQQPQPAHQHQQHQHPKLLPHDWMTPEEEGDVAAFPMTVCKMERIEGGVAAGGGGAGGGGGLAGDAFSRSNMGSCSSGESPPEQKSSIQFPWMKTTKSHAHQWKAHWIG